LRRSVERWVISAPQFVLAKAGENFLAFAPLTKGDPMKNRNVIFITLFLALGCLALLQRAQGVVPPPDGCYPGFTTAEGCNALNFLTTGAGNTGVGWYSLYGNTSGSYNTGLGAGALALNSADSNTAVGATALLLNTAGTRNTAVGTGAMVYNGAGEDNTATGYQALFSNTGGGNTGNLNTATGSQALYGNTAGRFNSGFGAQALFNNDSGEDNSAFGYQALYSNHSFFGYSNSAFGSHALGSNIDGQRNSAFGGGALASNVSGDNNTAIGTSAGSNIDGDGNVCVGASVLGEAGVSNSTYIRNVNTLAQPIVSGIDGVTVRLTDGRLGHGVSSRRYKQDIKPMDNASEALYALKPVTFHYNKEIDPTQTLDFGLIAEEVAEVNPELTVRDGEGKVSNYRRDAINAMLLNEFLKEHRKVEEQQATITELKSIVAQQQKKFRAAIAEQRKEFEARLNQQDAKIQRVSDEVGLSKPAPQIVASDE
jgi:hypothetical protein